MDCQAIDPKDKLQYGAFVQSTVPQVHGRGRWPTLFVDGHASITWYPAELTGIAHRTSTLQMYPQDPAGWGTGSLEWMDVP